MNIASAIRNKVRKLIMRHRSDSQSYVAYLRNLGAKIGERTIFYAASKTYIDETRPFLVEIGDDVQITRGVTFLTHGYDWSVLKGMYGEVLGSAGRIKIGNNVFIGTNAIILKGVTVGNNVVIGAGSLVNKDIPDNCVYAGNPARFICTIEEHYEKMKKAQLREAKCVYDGYVSHYGKEPGAEVFNEFFWLFHCRDEKLLPSFERQMRNVGNYERSMENFKESTPMFDGFDAFLAYLRK